MGTAVVAVTLAALALALVALVASNTPGSAAVLEQQTRVDAALEQLLAARRAQGSGFHRNNKEVAKARIAMRELEDKLGSEMKSVKTVLDELRRARLAIPDHVTALHASAAVKPTAAKLALHDDVTQPDPQWSKRTMQRGAMRGESTSSQLTKVCMESWLNLCMYGELVECMYVWSDQYMLQGARPSHHVRHAAWCSSIASC